MIPRLDAWFVIGLYVFAAWDACEYGRHNQMNKQTSFTIWFDELVPKELRGNSKAHWTKRWQSSSAWKDRTYIKLRELDWRKYDFPWSKINVDYDYYYWPQEIDPTNFQTGCKPIEDALLDEGVILNDGPNQINRTTANGYKAKSKNEVGFRMYVERVELDE